MTGAVVPVTACIHDPEPRLAFGRLSVDLGTAGPCCGLESLAGGIFGSAPGLLGAGRPSWSV